MYDKNQIIEEIKRVSKNLKTGSLKKKDFIKNTMIPVSTINFYISSWPDALIEAGFDGAPSEEVNDKDLLKDLIRIEKEFGETPTYALIEKNGKFSKEDYEQRWRNLNDAFNLAESKYGRDMASPPDKTVVMSEGSPEIVSPDKTMMATGKKRSDKKSKIDFEETLVSFKKDDMAIKKAESGEFSDNFSSDNILTIDDIENKEKQKKSKDESEPSFDYVSDDGGGIENLMDIDVKKKKKKKIIPETSNPAVLKSEKGKPLNFRGIKFPPIDTRGVIFMFGLVCEELNFVVESFGLDRYCFSGKRNKSSESEKWEAVNIGFVLNSLDLKKNDRTMKNCELLVCWENGWKDCPVEVLELSTTLKRLENY